MAFADEVKEKVISYLDGETVSSGFLSMVTDLAIEVFKEVRNYPSDYTEEKMETDMRKKINIIAYGVVELIGKDGVEQHKSYSENGINRTYKDGLVSTFSDSVTPFANVRSI